MDRVSDSLKLIWLACSENCGVAVSDRNLVLGMWEKDVQHLLMMTDCGISEEPSMGEPARASLVRRIYRFLDYHVSVA